nr:zonular occludens toxin domain-containing protein [Neisseria meningitidis]
MITLITGVPGSGKTLSVVSDLAKKINNEWKDRKIFIEGIPELTIETTPIPEGHSINDMHVWLQYPENNGSVVIIDEAQNVFPPRSPAVKAPPLVEWLHVHRHSGIDIILITQMPQRIDKHVRDLVGAHYHIHKTPLGIFMRYFWDYCANNPRSEFANARPEVYKLDKKAFGLYKSAEIHTKVKTPKSRVLYIIPIALVLFALFFYLGYKLLLGLGNKDGTEEGEAKTQTIVSEEQLEQVRGMAYKASGEAGRNIGNQLGSDKENQNLTKEMLEPTIDGHPESKPIYNGVRQVRQMEFPVACVKSSNSCNCYSGQATILKEIDKKTCIDYVDNGMPFTPYKEEQREIKIDTDEQKPLKKQVLVMDAAK